MLDAGAVRGGGRISDTFKADSNKLYIRSKQKWIR